MRAVNSKERKEILEMLREQYGYTGEFSYTIFASEDDKYYIINREVEPFLDGQLRIERLGIYFCQISHGELRFSIEGSQLIGAYVTKHLIEITPAERDEWMMGKDIPISTDLPQHFHIVRCGNDYFGCGKAKQGSLHNYVPKERYIGAAFTDEDRIDEA